MKHIIPFVEVWLQIVAYPKLKSSRCNAKIVVNERGREDLGWQNCVMQPLNKNNNWCWGLINFMALTNPCWFFKIPKHSFFLQHFAFNGKKRHANKQVKFVPLKEFIQHFELKLKTFAILLFKFGKRNVIIS